jgi:hypothetical protein
MEMEESIVFGIIRLAFQLTILGNINVIKTIFHQANTNLLVSQKELLLWHQQLSHATVGWVQTLM